MVVIILKNFGIEKLDKYMLSVDENRALGELDHPESSVINLKNVSHNIKDMWWDGDEVMGKIEISTYPIR